MVLSVVMARSYTLVSLGEHGSLFAYGAHGFYGSLKTPGTLGVYGSLSLYGPLVRLWLAR